MSRTRSLFVLLLTGGLILTACQPLVTPAAAPPAAVITPPLPTVNVVLETQNIFDVADDTETKAPLPSGARRGDADDPAIWIHPTDPAQSLVIGALKNGGLDVYDLDGQVLQSISPDGVRYNNVDLIYNFPLVGDYNNPQSAGKVDLAIATDRYQDTLAVFVVDATTRQLTDVSDPANPLVFTPAGQASDATTTAYGIATYASPAGQFYAFITRRATGDLAQLELIDNGAGQVGYRTVRTLSLPPPDGGEVADAQLEGMVVDQQLGVLYAAQEKVGIWKFAAAPDGSAEGQLLYAVRPAGTYLEADAEGLTIYYGPGEQGYLLTSSQGDNTFAVFTRSGANEYLGSFQIGAELADGTAAGLDGSQASDGAQVVNVPLGDRYPQGLLVVHDGSNQPEFTIIDEGNEENATTNFKFVAWESVANAFTPPLLIDTSSYHPRTTIATVNPPTAAASGGNVDQVRAIFTLPEIALAAAQNGGLPGSIANDRKMLLGGSGSDLWRAAGDPVDEFWMITDRGPNGQVEVEGKNRRTFPVPEFTPHILQVQTVDEAITVQQAIPILTQSGQPVTGLSNIKDFTEQGWDYSAQEKLDFNPNGLDTEGLVRTNAGEFWLVDEYAPSLLHVGSAGRVIKRYVPAGLDYSGADYPVAATLPALFSQRQNNRGFEGIALSPDESTLYLVLQSPLSNPDKDTAEASANTRLLVFDIASETVVGEYVYSFDDPAGYGEPDAPDEMKLSGVVALTATRLLILERTDKVAKVYAVDLAPATNLLGTHWDDPATTPSLEALTDLTAEQVTPLPKQLVIDLSQLPETPAKIEGIAVVDHQTLAIANDNDFNIGTFDAEGNNSNAPGVASHLLIISLAQPLP